MRVTPLIPLLAAAMLVACGGTVPRTPPSKDPAAKRLDIHGCEVARGEMWCERVFRCVNPRDLAIEKGIVPQRPVIEQYCAGMGHSPSLED